MPKAKTKSKKTPGKPKKKETGATLSKAFKNFAPIRELMNSNLGREVLADVLLAAAGAAAAALTKGREAGSANMDAARDAVKTASGAVAGVVTETARHFLPASLVEDEADAPAKGSRRKPKTGETGKRKGAPRKTAPRKTPAGKTASGNPASRKRAAKPVAEKAAEPAPAPAASTPET